MKASSSLDRISNRKLFKNGQCAVAAHGRGIAITGEIRFQDWADLLDDVASAHDSIQWMLGDLLAYGSLKYEENKFRIVVEQTGRKYSTVHKWGNVASKVPIEERRFNVSFTHYEQTAFIPKEQRERLLECAELERWTVAKLREEVEGLGKVIDIDAVVATTGQPSVVIGQRFEEYIGSLLEAMYPDHAWEHLGALKHQERGLDFVGRPVGPTNSDGVIGVQVKCHSPKQVPNDVEWTSFLAGCFTRGVNKAYFISTGRLSSNQLREVSECRQVTVLCGKELRRLAAKYSLPTFEI
jgi:hypothetical protein